MPMHKITWQAMINGATLRAKYGLELTVYGGLNDTN